MSKDIQSKDLQKLIQRKNCILTELVDAFEEAATVDHQIWVKYWARLLKMARKEAQRE
jgi:hypothetical protein